MFYLPIYVIFFRFICLVWSFYSVPFSHNCNITFNVALTASCDVIRVRQESPFVVKLMIYKSRETYLLMHLYH